MESWLLIDERFGSPGKCRMAIYTHMSVKNIVTNDMLQIIDEAESSVHEPNVRPVVGPVSLGLSGAL